MHIKKVMGQHYQSDTKTPFWTAFFRNQRSCKFVEESVGKEGSGVFMYRNLYNREGETQPKNLSGVPVEKVEKVEEKKETKSAMATAMSSSRNLDARRRLSHSAQMATLPLLVES